MNSGEDLVNPPAEEPVLIGDLKNHLRVSSFPVGPGIPLAAAPDGVSRSNGIVSVQPAAGQPLPGLGQTVALLGITDSGFNGTFVVQELVTVDQHGQALATPRFLVNQFGPNAASGGGSYQLMLAADEDTIAGYMLAARLQLDRKSVV